MSVDCYISHILIPIRAHRHKLRLERLQELLERRTAIEARMLASTRKIEHAILWADKAFDSALKRRLQGLEKHHDVRDLDVNLSCHSLAKVFC